MWISSHPGTAVARGASGEYSDYQYLSDQLDEMADEAGQFMVEWNRRIY